MGRRVLDGVSVGEGVRLKVADGVMEGVMVGVSVGTSVGGSVGEGASGVSVIGSGLEVIVSVGVGSSAPSVPGAMVNSLTSLGGGAGVGVPQAHRTSSSAAQPIRQNDLSNGKCPIGGHMCRQGDRRYKMSTADVY